MSAQINILDPIWVDCFAGGGGWSTGAELAIGRPIDIAINHDPAAVLMHKTNHPYTQHYCEDIFAVDPRDAVRGRKVQWAHFSPDCKHFSKAKGAKPVSKKIRGLAWIVLKWAALVQPDIISLENVEEFKTWGPVRRGKPIKAKSGETFQRWLSQLEALGYRVEHRELVACDYGAPTSRKRFFLIARRDGKPIVWPKPTHGPMDSEEVKSGRLLPWRSAAEIIDWNIPCYSVFDSRQEIKEKYGVNAVRPLAENTMRRVIRGVDKFTIRSGKPFIVECNHGGNGHTRDTDNPLNTVTGKYTGGLCEPLLVPLTITNTSNSVGTMASEPVHTVTTAGNQIYAAANLIQYHTERGENVRANSMDSPLPTADAANRYGLTTAQLTEYYGNGQSLSVETPMHTITGHDREAVVCAHINKYFGGVVGSEAAEPLPTVTSIDHNALAAAHIVEFKGQDIGQEMRKPLRTITTSAGEFAACHAYLVKAEKQDLRHWPEIRALLNRYCGYSLADDEIMLLEIAGTRYFISDIMLRMLTPRELYNANGFPPDYIIDRDYMGNEYKKDKQVARCGNAVPPPFATALIGRQYKDWFY